MALCSVGLQHPAPLEPPISGLASGDSSPALHTVLQLSLPGCARGAHCERRLGMGLTSASSPLSYDGTPSLLVCLHETQGSMSPCSSAGCSCCSTLEPQQQVLRSLMPDDIERRCAEDLAAAEPVTALIDAVSYSSRAFGLPALSAPDISRTLSMTSGAHEEANAPGKDDISTSPPPLRYQMQRGQTAEQQEVQGAHYLQDMPLGVQQACQQGTAVAVALQGEQRQVPQSQRTQFCFQQWRISEPCCYGMPGSGGMLPTRQHMPPPHRMQQHFHQPLQQPLQQLHQRLFSQHQLQQRLQQQVMHIDRGCFGSKAAIQYAAAAATTAAAGPWAPNVQAPPWGLFTGQWV